MKKLIISLCSILMVFTLVACGGGSSDENIKGDLPTLMNKLYEGVGELPTLAQTEVEGEMFAWAIGAGEDFTFDGYEEALLSEPMMSSVAHSVLLVRMEDGADVEAAKKAIKDNVNPRKWLCVGVDDEKNVIVDSRGDLIVLIMDNNYAQTIHENFKNLK